jgi:carboxyl-terminal processing protease
MPAVEDGPIALLVDDETGSSGEAVLISFTGADNVRSFGQPTAGYATANEAFVLPDGARLAITTSTMTDRTGRAYGNTPITPHTVVSRRTALDAAIEWLTQRR